MLGFSGWNLYLNVGRQMQTNGTNVILNLFFGTVANAAYGVGHQLSNAVYAFISNFTLAGRPQIIKYYSTGQIREMESLLNASTKYAFLMFFALAMPVILEMNFVMSVWLGKFPEYTVLFGRLFLVMAMVETLHINLNYAIQATSRIKLASIVGGTLFISIPIISYIAFKCGVKNVYLPMYISIFVYILVIMARLLIAKRLIPNLSLSDYCKNVLLGAFVICCIDVVIPLMIHYRMEEGWIRLILTLIASVVSMAMATYFFGIDRMTREKIKAVVKRKMHLHRK